MNVLVNLLENAAPNAVIALLAVLYLQRQIASASDKLRDKMDSDHRELRDKMGSDHRELANAVAKLGERVAGLEAVIQPPAR